MTASETTDGDYKEFSSLFFNAFLTAASASGRSKWQIVSEPGAEPTSSTSERIWIKVALDGSLRGEFLLEWRRSDALRLLAKILRQSTDDFSAQRDALVDLVRAGTREFQSAVGQEFGTFAFEVGLTTEPPAALASIVEISASSGDSKPIAIRMHLNRELTESLFLHSRVGNAAQKVWGAANAPAGKTESEAVNLDLVMDVELNVTLRFGQRQLTLREVLELTSGSVVELDRQVDEPVELFLDGMVIARGEAVVIDGNYGLRVTEVARPVSSAVVTLAQ
jgi:flagellar motor switch protein FliN/FliY